MLPIKSKAWIVQNPFDGLPKLTDFKLQEDEISPNIGDGEIICEAVYLSVDPYMRVKPLKPQSVMIGTQVAKIIQSKNSNFPIGSYIYGDFGWQTHTLVTDLENIKNTHAIKPYLCPDFGEHPISLALGICGRTGLSAYFGFLELCQPKSGEIVVISGASGAVGMLVGQIAKIKGCTVIGISGSMEKCKWLKDHLKFDYTINYKVDDVTASLKDIAPNGIDCYFDNVGGWISYYVMKQMRDFGRISVCGSISMYNNATGVVEEVPQITDFHRRNLRMEGFMISRWIDDSNEKWFAGIRQMLDWINEKKIQYKETIIDGFANMPQAFIDIFLGQHIGKPLIKI